RETAQMTRAEAVITEGVESAATAGSDGVGAHGSLTLAGLGWHAAELSRQETLAEVEAAMRAFGEHGDDAGLARALALRGRLRFWGGDFAGALEHLEEGAMHA